MTVGFRFFQCFSPPGDRWCGVLGGCVPLGSVSSPSTLQIFRDGCQLTLWGFDGQSYLGSVGSLDWGMSRTTDPRDKSGGCRTLSHVCLDSHSPFSFSSPHPPPHPLSFFLFFGGGAGVSRLGKFSVRVCAWSDCHSSRQFSGEDV